MDDAVINIKNNTGEMELTIVVPSFSSLKDKNSKNDRQFIEMMDSFNNYTSRDINAVTNQRTRTLIGGVIDTSNFRQCFVLFRYSSKILHPCALRPAAHFLHRQSTRVIDKSIKIRDDFDCRLKINIQG